MSGSCLAVTVNTILKEMQMQTKRFWSVLGLLIVTAMIAAACGGGAVPAATVTPETVGGFQ
ncbi:MAG: hypothetical protein UX79_C0036G0001, partial [candidate division WWE3 bacterium GW2011_GWB1_47_11]